MESFEEVLTAGGHSNSLGRADEVLRIVLDDRTRLNELFDCIFADDAWVRMRAIDTFEKIIRDNPELAKPYLNRIFTELTPSTQPSIQWHLAQIFSQVELTDTQRDTATSWLKNTIATTDVDWIVSVNTMKALLQFHKNGQVTTSELTRLFKIQESHSSKSVRKKAASFVASLQ